MVMATESGAATRKAGVISDPVHGSPWIAGQLRQGILDGSYKYGEKLPAERHLAEGFNASRATVRRALARLENEQLVSRQVGSGTFVKFRPPTLSGNIADLTSPLQLIDVRIGIEPQMTRLAVLNAGAREVEKLRGIVASFSAGPLDPETFTARDQAFHLAVAECTRNPLLVALYQQINDVRAHAQWNTMKGKVLSAERIAEYNQQHRNLFHAIDSRDLDAAVALITSHLTIARRNLVGVGST
jgi:DNA-binding FadR family transcriptional regulator